MNKTQELEDALQWIIELDESKEPHDVKCRKMVETAKEALGLVEYCPCGREVTNDYGTCERAEYQ